MNTKEFAAFIDGVKLGLKENGMNRLEDRVTELEAAAKREEYNKADIMDKLFGCYTCNHNPKICSDCVAKIEKLKVEAKADENN